MLLPDNIQPELSIYYNGGIVLANLKNNPKQDLIELYSNIKKNHELTFSLFLLSLDWLYLIEVAKYNERGEIELCL